MTLPPSHGGSGRPASPGGPPTRVLVVDDSAVVRQVLTAILGAEPDITVMGAVSDPVFAIARMKQDWPDVVVLDIEMPRMDGLTFLRKIMAARPTPVVVCSTLTQRGAATTLDALNAGAVEALPKPSNAVHERLEEQRADLVRAVRAAAAVNIRQARRVAAMLKSAPAAPSAPAGPGVAATTLGRGVGADGLVAIGASTGGTQALEAVLTAMPRLPVGILIVQHMPEMFTTAFAERLDRLSATTVSEASDGEVVQPGQAYIAPGGRQMRIERSGLHYRVRVFDGERVNRHKPSVDVLFESVAHHAGRQALGVILTGMGDDGARGMAAMRAAGAHTVGQDEKTCVVYGMPKAAYLMGAVVEQRPLQDISSAIVTYATPAGIPA